MFLCGCALCKSGTVEGDVPVWDMKLPCRMHPHWLEPVLYVCESAAERASPSEGLSVEPQSMLSLALKISSQSAERNVKVNAFFLSMCIFS